MTHSFSKHYRTKETPQDRSIPGKAMVKNSAGGFSFAVSDWERLARFLVLGSEGGSYYTNEQTLTIENAEAVRRLIGVDGQKVVDMIVDVSSKGRAPSNDPAIFALAMCAGLGDQDTKRAALRALPLVCRIGTHIFHFAEYVEGFRGWGRSLKRAVAEWYLEKPIGPLGYQVIKYQQRGGWSHRDLLRLSHPKPTSDDHKALFGYVVNGPQDGVALPNSRSIRGYEIAKIAKTKGEVVDCIGLYGLTREMIPTKWLNEPDVWTALLSSMPLMATIRSLGKMAAVGALKPMGGNIASVKERLSDTDYIRKSRAHPLSILVAQKIYEQGHGMKGSLSWESNPHIVDALNRAFYSSFENVEPTNKRTMLALDVSGSMGHSTVAGSPITPREASAAMALVTAKSEPNYMTTIFSSAGRNYQELRGFGGATGISEISISPNQRLPDVIRQVSMLPFGRTDCSLPMLYALQRKIEIEVFVIYTDSETWVGNIHPVQALEVYRREMGIPAKLVVVGMTSNGFSIADPNDRGMLDVVGFDTATPKLISEFCRE